MRSSCKFIVFYFCAVISLDSMQAQTRTASQPAITMEAVTSSQPRRDGIDVKAGPASLRITALRDDIIRVRIALGSKFPEDASWAVLPGPRGKSVAVQATQDAASVGFRTAALDVRVERTPLRLVVRDLAGNIISADAVGRPTQFQLGGFSVHKTMPGDEHYFGLGDKAGTFDRRNQAYTLWNTDIGTQESIDPIYKSIPFFLGIGGGRSYGLFLDNTWRTWFDFGKQARDAYSFGAEGGPLDYYLIYGANPKQVVEGYAYLTGTHPLPPLWSLGFQQSRYSYTPESQIREIADRMRADKIPSDVLYLDIDYQDRNRPFTVDAQTFPNFPGLVSDLRKQNFHLVLITDLHVARIANQGYAPYDSGEAGNHFVKKADGSEFVGIVWPGPAVFPDFTRAKTRDWWGGLYKEFAQDGVAGFWNDMNEPAVFDGPGKTMPLDNIHRIEEPGFATRNATHAEIHNIVGLENARATYDGLLKLRPDERPFVLTRATFAGGQRYGFTWTGDNSATWNHLRLATQQLLNLGTQRNLFRRRRYRRIQRFAAARPAHPLDRDRSLQSPLPRPHHQGLADAGSLGPRPGAGSDSPPLHRDSLPPDALHLHVSPKSPRAPGCPWCAPFFSSSRKFSRRLQTGSAISTRSSCWDPACWSLRSHFAETLDNYVVSFPKGDWYDFWTGLKAADSPARTIHCANFQRYRQKRARNAVPLPALQFIPRLTLCRCTSGAEAFCRCSRSSRARTKLPRARWNFGSIPASGAAAHCISMTATPALPARRVSPSDIHLPVRWQVGARKLRRAPGNLCALVEKRGGCDLRLAVSPGQCEAVQNAAPLQTSYDATSTLSTS